MPKDKCLLINIRKYLEDAKLGEHYLERIISEYSCDKNFDVERFLKNSAIEFTKKNQSVTYLVFSTEDGELLGYFAIALKVLTVNGANVSGTVKRKLLRISEVDEETETYTMPAYLIAQLGKNFANGANKRLAGEELLEMAWSKIEELEYQIGGCVTFLEAYDEENLLNFYKKNRFQRFDTRQIVSSEEENYKLVQFLRVI